MEQSKTCMRMRMNALSKSFPIALASCVFVLQGCANIRVDNAISKYEMVAPQVKLGDSKSRVLPILEPTQSDLLSSNRKKQESYLLDKGDGTKSLIEIFFYRSNRIPDGRTTDDEFTPYIFTDGVLTGIGWTLLGGPKSMGRDESGMHISVGNDRPRNLSCYQNGPYINCH